MAFDFAWDFRLEPLFASDPAYAVLCVAEAYPHLYTNANGLSINAGFSSGTVGTADRNAGNDARIAGINFVSLAAGVFQIDLSSGSAPGAGTYSIDLAFGDASAGQTQDFTVADNAVIVIDGRNGGAGYATAANHFRDASLADVAGGAVWNGTPVTKTFSTTTVKVNLNPDALGANVTLAHFRLTLIPAGGLGWKLAGDHAALAGRGGLAA